QGIKADGSALAGQAAERIAGSLFVNAADPEGVLKANTYVVSAGRRDGLAASANSAVASGSNASSGTTITGLYGTLQVGADGSYRYVVDNSNATVNALAAGSRSLVDSFVLTLRDSDNLSGEQTLQVQILGSDDGPLSSGQILNATVRESGLTAAGATEPGANASGSAGALFANLYDPEGTTLSLTVTNAGSLGGSYGSLTLAADGSYTYNLNQSHTSVNALAAGETLDDVFTINVVDQFGFTGSQQLRIRINGSNDAPVISVNTAAGHSSSAARSETNTTLTASGSLGVSDVDLSNTVAAAVVGVAKSGTTTGLATGLTTNALVLDGSGDFVEIADSSAIDLTSNFTLEAWINPTGTGSGGFGGGIVLNKENSYEIARFGDGSIQFALMPTNGGWSWVDTGLIAPLNTWSHIALSHSGSSITVFLNGGTAAGGSQVTFSSSSNPALYPSTIQPSNQTLRIGSRQHSQDFQGQIADVRIWNTARSASEIASARFFAVDLASASLIANYLFSGTGNSTPNAATSTNRAADGVLVGNASRSIQTIAGGTGITDSQLLAMLNL
ncbi:MAG: hypothetical protein EBZ51_12060, partial [Synechococcaceae bacterium WB9_2_112]|nr:hypothetical protein [Synechococcaceae bacterium WB9_2_112]